MFEVPAEVMWQAARASRDVAHHLAPVPAADATMDRQLAALKAAELAACRAYLAQGDALLDLWDTSPADARCGRRPHVLAEAGLALGLDPLTVGARLHVADALRAHPMLRALLSSGRITVPHALAAVDEISVLGTDSADDDEAIELADRALHEVLLAGGLLGWDSTPGRLRTALRRALIRLDPVGAARRRQEQTAARTRVRLRARADGLANWTSTGPALQLQAADRLLEVLSGASGPDDPRTYGQRQLDALLAALVARAGTAVPLELQLEVPVETATVLSDPTPGALPDAVAIRAELTPELLALLTSTAASDAAARPDGRTDEAAGDPARPQPPRRRPEAPPRRRRPRQGVPELLECGPVDPALLGELLLDPRGLPLGLSAVRLRRVCVDRTGQPVAVDARPVVLPASGPPGQLLRRLLHGLPAPPPGTAARRPTPAQQRVVVARDPHCTFPGCGRRGRRADLDHRRRYPEGPTSVANLHPLCRSHHRLKHDGWSVTRDAGGRTTWTSPRGQRAPRAPA